MRHLRLRHSVDRWENFRDFVGEIDERKIEMWTCRLIFQSEHNSSNLIFRIDGFSLGAESIENCISFWMWYWCIFSIIMNIFVFPDVVDLWNADEYELVQNILIGNFHCTFFVMHMALHVASFIGRLYNCYITFFA